MGRVRLCSSSAVSVFDPAISITEKEEQGQDPPTSETNDWRPHRLLLGCLEQVVLTLHGSSPEGTCAFLPIASIGDQDHSFLMKVWKFRCCLLP